MTTQGTKAGDGYLQARLEDLALRAVRTGRPEFSRFLDPAQCFLAQRAATRHGATLRLWGGYEDAERRLAEFSGERWNATEAGDQWPLRWLRSRWDPRYASPQHRDLLGALLAQGIERENLGDIIVEEGQAFCAALPDMAEFLATSLQEAGRAKLTCDVLTQAPALPEPKGTLRRDTVASLRLDTLLAAAWNLSRGDALELIRQGKVQVNHLPQEHPDARLAQGALVSLRGKGRFRLAEVGNINRKGRVGVTFFHYQ
jgi:RNA-binding protein YlmH